MEKRTDIPMFHIQGNGWKSVGQPTDDGFVVFAGSTVGAISQSFITHGKAYYNYRLMLENDNTIINGAFAKDFIFKSAAQAASVVSGRLANVNAQLKSDDGRTFGECYPKKQGKKREFVEKAEKRDDTPPMGYTVMDDGTPRYVIPSNEGGYIEFRGNEAKRRAEEAHATPGVVMEVSVAND